MSLKEKVRFAEERKTIEDEGRKDEKGRTGIQRFGAELCLPQSTKHFW